MEPNEYVEAKKSAMQTKLKRKLWLEAKIAAYRTEIEDGEAVRRRDERVLEKLELMVERHAEKTAALARAKELMTGLSGDDIELALVSFMNAKTDLEELEAEMRMTYYGK